MAQKLVRTAAVGFSIALAAFVIVRAQAGCDSTPKAEPTPAAAPAPSRTPTAEPKAPEPKAPEPKAPEPKPPEPEPPGPGTPEATPTPAPVPATDPPKRNLAPAKPDEDKKFFPASKSGIDFGQRSSPVSPTPNPAPQQNAAPR